MSALSVSPTSYAITQELDELTPAPTGYVRPASTDDGFWAYCGQNNGNATLADKFLYARGGDGTGIRSNPHMRTAYATDAAAISDRWVAATTSLDDAHNVRLCVYDPANKRFSALNTRQWPLDRGAATYPPHPDTLSSSATRTGAFDATTNTLFRFANVGNSPYLYAYQLNTQRIRVWAINLYQVNGKTIYLDETQPQSESQMTEENGLAWYDSGAGRYRTHGMFHWEHQAVWLNENDGKLYVVSPGTGFLWCFETRGTEMTRGDGLLTIPFYPVGNRVPLRGHYPSPGDVTMHAYLVPFKGGLFWTIDSFGGNDGCARYGFWRRLGYTGDWTPITLPVDWACNSVAAKSRSINNDEILAISSVSGLMGGRQTDAFYLIR
jgi:hypothetical protein